MSTKNVVPRTTHQGQLGRVDKVWSAIHVDDANVDTLDAQTGVTTGTLTATGNTSLANVSASGNVQVTGSVSGASGNFTGLVSAGSISSSGNITGSTLTLTSNTADTLFWLTRKGTTAYQVGDIAYSPSLPSWARLECVQAGTTSIEEPTYGSVQQGTAVTDGTVRWIVDDVRDATMTGGVIYLPFTKTGYLACTGQSVNRADYPRLVQFATDNNLWTSNQTNEPWKFGNGDGSTTMTVPNYLARVIQGGSTTAKLEAGLPNIEGKSGSVNLFSTLFLSGSAPSGTQFETIGAVYNEVENEQGREGNIEQVNGGYQGCRICINANKGNPIYGNSSTVQPPAIQLIPQIKY